MLMRWIWRGLAIFLGRKAWEAYQRRQAGSGGQVRRTPGR